MAVTMRPEMGRLQIAQRRAGEEIVRVWIFGQDLSSLVGGSGEEGALMEGTLIEGALIVGTEIDGAEEGSGTEIERSSTLGKYSSSRGSGGNGRCLLAGACPPCPGRRIFGATPVVQKSPLSGGLRSLGIVVNSSLVSTLLSGLLESLLSRLLSSLFTGGGGPTSLLPR